MASSKQTAKFGFTLTPRLRRGFTLIELLVVIAVIGLLASVILVSLNGVRLKARDVKRRADLAQISKALELHYNDNNDRYPASGGATSPNSGWSNSNDTSWNALTTALAPYISKLPHDPKESASGYPGDGANVYSYAYWSDPGGSYGCDRQEYLITANLENAGGVAAQAFTTCGGTAIGPYGTLMVSNKVK